MNSRVISNALKVAQKLLDSVAYVSTPGDTKFPLLLIEEALKEISK